MRDDHRMVVSENEGERRFVQYAAQEHYPTPSKIHSL